MEKFIDVNRIKKNLLSGVVAERKFLVVMLLAFQLLQFGCTEDKKLQVIELEVPKDIIPEGIVVDPKSEDIFLSSLHLEKIMKTNSEGKNGVDVIKPNSFGYTVGVGMEIKQNYLFALGSINRGNTSVLLQIDLANNEIVNHFKLNDSIPNFLNDLAVDKDLNAYMTDTDHHKVYKLNYKLGKIEEFFTSEDLKYPNGIAISDDETKLFVDSYFSGIRIVDLQNKKVLNLKHEGSSEIGIDGLKYHKQHLYGIRNGGNDRTKHGVIKFKLSEKMDSIVSTEELLFNHAKMDLPTTLAINDNFIYVLANSQLENFDHDNNAIINRDSLNSTFVLKLKID